MPEGNNQIHPTYRLSSFQITDQPINQPSESIAERLSNNIFNQQNKPPYLNLPDNVDTFISNIVPIY